MLTSCFGTTRHRIDSDHSTYTHTHTPSEVASQRTPKAQKCTSECAQLSACSLLPILGAHFCEHMVLQQCICCLALALLHDRAHNRQISHSWMYAQHHPSNPIPQHVSEWRTEFWQPSGRRPSRPCLFFRHNLFCQRSFTILDSSFSTTDFGVA